MIVGGIVDGLEPFFHIVVSNLVSRKASAS